MNHRGSGRAIQVAPRTVLTAIAVFLGLAIAYPPTAAATEGVSVPPEDYRVVRHQLLVDVPRNQAIFDLWFSEPPRFFELDERGGQRYGFQHFMRALSQGDFHRRRHSGERIPPLRPMLVVSGFEIHRDGKVVVREVDPLYKPEPGSGAWGPKVAEVPVRQHEERVRFSVPLSVFDHEDGMPEQQDFSVHYYLEAGSALSSQEGLATVAGAESESALVVAPKSPDAPIWPTRKGPLVVDVITRPAVHYGNFFFAQLVDLETVRFGPKRIRPYRSNLMHVDDDGYLDLRLWFTTAELGLTCLDNELWLTGEWWDGYQRITFVGFDNVRIARCPATGADTPSNGHSENWLRSTRRIGS